MRRSWAIRSPRYSDRVPLSEKKLIQQIRRSTRTGGSVVTGIGDDCAVLRVPAGLEILVTTDFSIENVHFRRDWHTPESVGRRCLTRGLSDIAAMGGDPRAAFLSLAVPNDCPQKWIDRFLQGLLGLAQEFKIPLAGGDTAASPDGIVADIVVIGSVPRGEAILRSGAKAGDRIYVTGDLGHSAAAIAALLQSHSFGWPRRQAFRPLPRVAVGQHLRRHGLASAMIDLSDGLSTDLEHICQESHVGAELEGEAIPRARESAGKRQVGLDFALHGGDDYELLFTSSAAIPRKIAGIRITQIGRIKRGREMLLIAANGKSQLLQAKGWEHFRKNF
jgi:thiamine-monophosphate kinase